MSRPIQVLSLLFIVLALGAGACQAATSSPTGPTPPSPPTPPTLPSGSAPTPAPSAVEPTAAFGCPVPSLALVPPSNRLTGVTVTVMTGFDRVAFEFGPAAAGSGSAPSLAVAPASPPFVEGASGRPLAVAGERFIALTFRDMVIVDEQGNPSDPGPGRLTGSGPAVREVVRSEAFEGVVSWLIGTAAPGCARVAVDQAAGRVLVDVAHP